MSPGSTLPVLRLTKDGYQSKPLQVLDRGGVAFAWSLGSDIEILCLRICGLGAPILHLRLTSRCGLSDFKAIIKDPAFIMAFASKGWGNAEGLMEII